MVGFLFQLFNIAAKITAVYFLDTTKGVYLLDTTKGVYPLDTTKGAYLLDTTRGAYLLDTTRGFSKHDILNSAIDSYIDVKH